MKNMKTDEIRESFLSYFEKKGHKRVSSDSLVPHNDPTLLFSGAGMNQFKDYFLGIKKDYRKATSSQKCIRTGDLDEVGRTAFHHSFFEMLGNFSFGDYFKEETIHWAWEYLTEVLQIPVERLRVSVHKSDEESFKIWRDKIGVRENLIYKLGDKGNFWPSNAPSDGPDGPCGPCSEIYFDQHPELKTDDIDSPRFAEIWNLVFTQFDRQGRNNLVPLKQKNIDTGMGLERLACVLQSKQTNFEIDIFQPINQQIEQLLGVKDIQGRQGNLYAITDHVRAAVFAMNDGVLPSNEGRGYVIRKLIRRALWHAHQISPEKRVTEPFLHQVVGTVVKMMKGGYPELVDAEQSIETTLQGEEERFLDTLETGLDILEDKLARLEKQKAKKLSGDIVFELYDTYGFPEELTRTIAESRHFEIDTDEFNKLMSKQRERAKQASQISSSIFVSSDLEKTVAGLPETSFLGYESLEAESKVLYTNLENNKGVVVLDQSPFYAEGGGQVGDKGTLESDSFLAKVLDTQNKDGHFLHVIEVEKGSLNIGDSVIAKVDKSLRDQTMRNHTATHLLHAALRASLGKQVRQLGSLVSPEKLRFDYSYAKALTPEQIQTLEMMVNAQILKNNALEKEVKSLEDAKKDGAIAFFGEKYGDKVRVVSISEFSKELCGGTHCHSTGQIGSFIIISETSVASGTRRIEALTGEKANEYVAQMRSQMADLALTLKTTPDEVKSRITKLQESLKKLEKEKKQGAFSAQIDTKKLLQSAKPAGVFRFVAYKSKDLEMTQLRKVSDTLRDKGAQTVYLLASTAEDKISILLGVSSDLKKYSFDVRELFKNISELLGASGGGRPDLVQAGGQNDNQLDQNWTQIITSSVSFLKQTDIEKTAKN